MGPSHEGSDKGHPGSAMARDRQSQARRRLVAEGLDDEGGNEKPCDGDDGGRAEEQPPITAKGTARIGILQHGLAMGGFFAAPGAR